MLMRLKQYINESAAKGGVQKYFDKLLKMPPNKAEKVMKDSWTEFSNLLKVRVLEDDAIKIINKHFKTRYTSLDQIDKGKISSLPSIKIVNEDIKHYWDFIKGEAFPTLSFYPALSCWLELDKLLRASGDFDGMKFSIYAVFWAVLVSGKFIALWKKWKKENPKQFKKEGSKKNPFGLKSKKFEFE